MTQVDLQKLTFGLSRTWAGYLKDWDRSLRSGNYPATTRYNYLPATAQLGRNLAEHSPDPDAPDAAADPAVVTRAHVESFQAWMITTRSASTAVNKHKGLQQFFKWLMVDEQAITASPMQRVRMPKTPTKLVPVLRDEDTSRLLTVCKGAGFVNLRDEALIRLYANTGARLSEVGTLLVEDLDLSNESVHYGSVLRPAFATSTPTAGATATPTNGNSPAAIPATSCSCSAGPPTTCPATTAPAPPPNAPSRPKRASPSANGSSHHRNS